MTYTGHNKELAENKLILLYIMDKIDMPLTNIQITKIIMENNLMNYFSLQHCINELCSDNLLSTGSSDKKSYYTITESGKNTLKYLEYLIPETIKNNIDNKIKDARKKIRNETLISADFIPESENKYMVNCSVREDDFTLIEIKIAVGNKNDARNICEKWKNYTQTIYSEIIETLTKKRD